MTIKDKYFPGTTVSRYLSPSESSWGENVYQSGKPVLDSELNLSQELGREIQNLLLQKETPSGFLRGPGIDDSQYRAFSCPAVGSGLFLADSFIMPKLTALVAGMPVVIEYSDITDLGLNRIQLDTAPVNGGAPPAVKRTDFVFLEVFRALVAPSPHGTGTIEVADPLAVTPGDTITLAGTVLTATAGVPAVDEFQIGATAIITAGNIRDAINLPGNSFLTICTAQLDITTNTQVNLRAVSGGLAGNITFVSSDVAALIPTPGGGNFTGGSDRSNKPSQDTIYRHGNTLSPAGVNLVDNIEDPVVGTESTQRVQLQYRIRVTGQSEAINFKTQNGFRNDLNASTSVLARGTQSSGVASYPFVPADNTTTDLNSSAPNYGIIDQGLFVAGDGSQTAATALGSVDGYVYAIPICFVFRRNDASGTGGFDPLNNTNGALSFNHAGFANTHGLGAIPATISDRPDQKFHNAITDGDILDLRRTVSQNTVDLKAELEKQMNLLLDGNLKTWALDGASKNELGNGSGDVSSQFLVCNEIGRDAAHGGNSPISGDTTRGDTIANFDHVRRRFGDQSVVERRIFPILPNDAPASEPGKYVVKEAYAAAFATWAEGDVINIDLDSLNATGLGDWTNATSSLAGSSVSNFWPLGTKITDVLVSYHDDGKYGTANSPEVQVDRVLGIGTPHVEILLGANARLANGGVSGAADYPFVVSQVVGTDTGSPRRIFVELEITYPVGSGTTDTPDLEVNPNTLVPAYFGSAIENDSAQRPNDWEGLPSPTFRAGKREIGLEYKAGGDYTPATGVGTPIAELLVAFNLNNLRLPRRINYDSVTPPTLTESSGSGDALVLDAVNTTWGSSERVLSFTGSTVLSQLIQVTYFAQDPVPNFGVAGGGYQISTYYRSNAPQTLATQEGTGYVNGMPATLSVQPLVMSRDLWTNNISVGSNELPYPYINPSDQIAVNADLVGSGAFPGEWVLQAQADISLSDFDVSTGLLNLHTVVPIDSNSTLTFTDLDKDTDLRLHYKVSDAATYRPTAMARNLSGPAKHKVFIPMLVQSTIDSVYFRKGEVLLLVVSRFAVLDDENNVIFEDSGNTSCAAIYRTNGILILASER